ncbi:MAG: hypothetical protein GXO76_04100 [Calditrichaeota bacterium]|nr:hypothetical protein [Calditrichota bacterium]
MNVDFRTFIPVALKIREAVLPLLDSRAGKAITGMASSGDTTFRLDEIAEEVLRQELDHLGIPLAYYSEDRGFVKLASNPAYVLIVDPVDGTRPAASGFEMAVVSIAIARFRERPLFRDLVAGIVVEIKTGQVYFASTAPSSLELPPGKGLLLSDTADLTRLFWSFDVVGRPIRPLMAILGDLIQGSALNGGTFLWNSAAYSITRLLTGQLDAYLDLGGFLLENLDQAELHFREAGNGRIMGLFPYDIAAARLIAKQGGVFISDAHGNSLDDFPLIPEKDGQILSLVAASNAKLHEKLLFYIQRHLTELSDF